MDPASKRRSKRRGPSHNDDDKPPSKKHSVGNKTTSRSSSRATSPATSPKQQNGFDVMQFLDNLEPLPAAVPRVQKLSKAEILELEAALEFRTGPDKDDYWRDDWGGNLALAEKEVTNPSLKNTAARKTVRQSFLEWARCDDPSTVRLLKNLLRHFCTLSHTPDSAKKILGTVDDSTPVEEVIVKVRRASFDPQVLKEDGWIVEKSETSVGATGGPFLIGDKIRSDNSDAVVIAYIHDPDIGDLWKAMWADDLLSFDLEAEELLEAKRKWERRYEQAEAKQKRPGRSNGAPLDFKVKGIEYGIVVAASFTKGSRQGVYWPARVMHASEGGESAQGRRTLAKQKVELVFLAPYWKSDDIVTPRARRTESMSESSGFNSLPLLQIETLEASRDTIKEFPLPFTDAIDLKQLLVSFRFTGLPGPAFSRYLDAHRMAMALRLYARDCLEPKFKKYDEATAGLFDTHMLSVVTPEYPQVVLNLPFHYILSQLPRSSERLSGGGLAIEREESETEPVILLASIVAAMKPPQCWGGIPEKQKDEVEAGPLVTAEKTAWARKAVGKDSLSAVPSDKDTSDPTNDLLRGFMTTFPALNDTFNLYERSPPLVGLINCFAKMIANLAAEDGMAEQERNNRDASLTRKLKQDFIDSWVMLKIMGEESLASISTQNFTQVSVEWRKACGRIYNFILQLFTNSAGGKGFSIIMTDSRCNGHITPAGCFERNVRLPAALKGARLAIGSKPRNEKMPKQGRFVSAIPDKYVKFVEERLISKAHDATYLKRMKSRCAEASTAEDGTVLLTEDSDGEGGEDTVGSHGTWRAAIVGVAAAVAAADKILTGECINAFCAIRPPGHHAGRKLHAMKAVSNGFCILNTVACAAIFAAAPVSEGGLGLSRICVIDFDVHHGNGTQDILCSTYDPRYLYVSLHAGGAEVNGNPLEDDEGKEHLRSEGGIYPGRCGDDSPHQGVLNIPLGAKVTPHGVGTALLQKVKPRVESFAPDLIILSAGFDAHKNDPMGLGSLRAEDFYTITDTVCSIALRYCNGRVLSVLEEQAENGTNMEVDKPDVKASNGERKQPTKYPDLGSDLPEDMDDQVTYHLQQKLEKCHEEGFIDCVKEHVRALIKNNVPY